MPGDKTTERIRAKMTRN